MSSAALLPPNAMSVELALSLSMARLADVPPKCREMWNPDTCPASHLPWLAWAFSVDAWNHDWSDTLKRAVIKASFKVHQHKGTVGALRDALSAIGYDIELMEWFQEFPPGDPYTFGLTAELEGQGIEPGLWDEIEAVALAAKNARSHLRYVRLRSTVRGKLFVGGTTLSAETVEIQPHTLTEIETRGPLYVGCALITHETVEIYPRPSIRVLGVTGGVALSLSDGSALMLN